MLEMQQPAVLKKISVKFGSWFEGANIKYETVWKLTYCWWRNLSNDNAEYECGVGDDTVINWYNFCREICKSVLKDDDDGGKIGGLGVKVEIDESKFGKRYQNKGRVVDGVWVFRGIEAQTKKTVSLKWLKGEMLQRFSM